MVAPSTFNFTTGPSQLPDVGKLSYNGCVFSPLFTTQVSGNVIKDDAQRTTKFMEYTIKVDGYVTKPDGSPSIILRMMSLRDLITEQGGALIYKGRGCDIEVNNGNILDVAWGPTPEVLEFQPLGAGNSAKIVWQCKVRVNEQAHLTATRLGPVAHPPGRNSLNPLHITGKPVPENIAPVIGGGIAQPMLQFNYGSTVTYSEDGFSKLDVQGVLEIPLTRSPNQSTRTLQRTADDLREEIDARIMKGIDLNKFRLTNRVFNLSRDKRTLDWNISAEEMPYQQMPPDCTLVHGSYSVRPAKSGPGLCQWLCNLRVTYTVRADKPRSTALLAFYALMRHRMLFAGKVATFFGLKNRAMLWDFNVEEGLYLDSKTVTFSATWRMVNVFEDMMKASGVWKKLPETDPGRDPLNNLWAISMRDVEGTSSWLTNRAKASADIIVDFGS